MPINDNDGPVREVDERARQRAEIDAEINRLRDTATGAWLHLAGAIIATVVIFGWIGPNLINTHIVPISWVGIGTYVAGPVYLIWASARFMRYLARRS